MLLEYNLPFLKKIDWLLIMALTFLACFGLAAIYSVALGQGLGEFLNFQKQLIWLAVGLVVLFFFANFDYHYWQKLSWLGYFISLVLLLLVLTPLGSTIRGTRGWFSLGFFNFQPVELTKVFLILVLANIYSQYGRAINKLSHMIIVGLALLPALILVMLQPDFGSAMVLFSLWFVSFFLITKNRWHFFLVVGLMIVSFCLAWFFGFQDYQRARIITFINPATDPLGRGYNVRQAVIAVGGGRLLGRGLGFGSQSQLKFIPESQTDFIFAVIAEELGFIGVLFVIGFFFLVFYRLYRIGLSAPDDFGLFLSLLVLILLFSHVVINIGMNINILPVTGISLPFVSYGGSFLIIMLILMGMVLNVHRSSLILGKR